MYITTFYSFKGGVGRTLALVNIGLELAKAGRKILLVDFDLEAPGIDTFQELAPKMPRPGVVDYIRDYLESAEEPDVRRYIYEAPLAGVVDGRVWVMPAGKRCSAYASKLASIDWAKLYFEQDGFLLLEDLKSQWQETLEPDYVLVDSRTGHTETSGICTRQLPDSVVVLFIPNQQNLMGLKGIVDAVRYEKHAKPSKDIDLLFVVSNVPDLDDEDEILKTSLTSFKEELGYRSLAATIHRYDSLSLLNQTLFSIKRPRSRLAAEYRQLANAITRHNPEDRQGALSFIDLETRRFPREYPRRRRAKDQLEAILKRHNEDAEVLFRAARLFRQDGAINRWSSLVEQAIEAAKAHHQKVEAEWLIDRAEARILVGRSGSAIADIRTALGSDDLHLFQLLHVIELLGKADDRMLREIWEAPIVRRLDPEAGIRLSSYLSFSRNGLVSLCKILPGLLEGKNLQVREADAIRLHLVLAYIGIGRYRDAMMLIADERPNPDSLGIEEAFNYGMAEWAVSRKVPADFFRRVLALDPASRKSKGESPNYHQCLAVALFLLGCRDDATARLKEAQAKTLKEPGGAFSCWAYLERTTEDFMHDLSEMTRFVSGDEVVPPFFSAEAELRKQR